MKIEYNLIIARNEIPLMDRFFESLDTLYGCVGYELINNVEGIALKVCKDIKKNPNAYPMYALSELIKYKMTQLPLADTSNDDDFVDGDDSSYNHTFLVSVCDDQIEITPSYEIIGK